MDIIMEKPMIADIYRKKLLYAILYFSSKVEHPYKLKIFKLLYFLDFKHIQEKGFPITNLEYYTYEMGPIPEQLFNELKKGIPDDFKDYLEIEHISFKNGNKAFKFKPLRKPDLDIFTNRERRILDELIFIFKDTLAEKMSEITHLKNSPWATTKKEKGEKQKIDYIKAIDNDSIISKEDAEDILKERNEMFLNHSIMRPFCK